MSKLSFKKASDLPHVVDSLVINSRDFLFTNEPMTKEEATSFFGSDTIISSCVHYEYDMITEKTIASYEVENLPRLNGRLFYNSNTFIFYSIQKCPDQEKMVYLDLYISPYNDKILNSFQIHSENENEVVKSSIINTKTMSLFLYELDENKNKKHFRLYRITETAPYFIKQKEVSVDLSSDNLLKTIKELGWAEEFGLYS